MIEFGSALKQAREKAGITLEELFEKTRINLKHLRAIESGDFPSVPQTYVRAFIREYARIVGLDEDRTVEAYNAVAERERGIPQPPKPIDNSNILPHPDESIEIFSSSPTPRSVEVQGKVEVPDEPAFVPPVRKSAFVAEGAEAIEIRTTPPSKHVQDLRKEEPAPEVRESKNEEQPVLPEPTSEEVLQTPEERVPESPASPSQPPVESQKKRAFDDVFSKMISPTGQKEASAEPRRKSVYDLKPPIPSEEISHAKREPESVRPTVPEKPILHEQAPKNAHPHSVKRESDSELAEQRRILLIGSIVVLIIAVAIYGAYYFGSQEPATSEEVLDSAGVQASIDAGKFIDSAQQAMNELPEMPPDTAKPLPKEPKIEKPKTSAKEDSLLLEAVSTAPVWFSIRMDTVRTERGTLGTNDHRTWKAKDRFVITLGDAGAVTFFLNGKEIGTLGEDGSVVKNITLSRLNLSGN